MRTCDAVGVQEIFVLNTRDSTIAKFGKKSSASAAGWLTIRYFDSIGDCISALKERGYHIYATHLGEQAHSLYELDFSGPVALVFGNEHAGVSDEFLKHCDGNFIIPQVGMVKSLNISVACAVTLYEAYRQREAKGFYTGVSRLPGEMHQNLSTQWGLINEE